jgi:hypothetical protein
MQTGTEPAIWPFPGHLAAAPVAKRQRSGSVELASPWRMELTEVDRARLDPGPHDLPRRPDVLVVGGGVVGVATAATHD